MVLGNVISRNHLRVTWIREQAAGRASISRAAKLQNKRGGGELGKGKDHLDHMRVDQGKKLRVVPLTLFCDLCRFAPLTKSSAVACSRNPTTTLRQETDSLDLFCNEGRGHWRSGHDY